MQINAIPTVTIPASLIINERKSLPTRYIRTDLGEGCEEEEGPGRNLSR